MERKVNRYGSRYVYYHCTHKRRGLVCREKGLEEGQLEEQILDFLRTIRLDQRELDRLLALIEQERAKEIGADGGIKKALEKALDSCTRNLDSLTKPRYRELIGDDEFIRQRAGLSQEQGKLQQKIAQLKAEQWIAPSQKLFLFSNRAVFWLTHGNPSEKRLIVSTVGSHLSLRSKELNIDAKKPFQILQERGSLSTLWCRRESHSVRFAIKRMARGIPQWSQGSPGSAFDRRAETMSQAWLFGPCIRPET
jgi:hypothetical protein